jgi:hypothetical protein
MLASDIKLEIDNGAIELGIYCRPSALQAYSKERNKKLDLQARKMPSLINQVKV